MTGFRSIKLGLERFAGFDVEPRHRHTHAYAAIVLSGSYEEAGDAGRYMVRAGDVLVHSQFDAHLDRFTSRGVEILNVPLADSSLLSAVGHVEDIDTLVRFSERSPREIAQVLLDAFRERRSPAVTDWPDQLARTLIQQDVELHAWADDNGLAAATVSRSFRQVYGVSPSQFRAQARAIRAWRQLIAGTSSLAGLAADIGYADQSHMTREVRRVTGFTPGHWRMRYSSDKRCRPAG